MLRLALKAFYPGKPPFPLLHVDTTWKFREMYAFRERMAREHGPGPARAHQRGRASRWASTRSIHGSAVHTDVMKTQALKQALDKYGFDAAFGGARRDEESSRAKERDLLVPLGPAPLGPEEPAPRAVAALQRAQRTRASRCACSRSRTGPSSTSGSTSTSSRFRSCRSTSPRSDPWSSATGTLIMVDDERHAARARGAARRSARCASARSAATRSSGAIESDADTLTAIIREMLLTRTSERQGRLIDHDQAASMERKKQEGYF